MAYNGWSNYATWIVSLWVLDGLRDYSTNTIGGPIDAEQVRNFVEEILEMEMVSLPKGLISDLINATLDNINWQELADAASEE